MGDLWGTDFDGVLGRDLPFCEGVLGDLQGSGEGVGGGPPRLIFGAGAVFPRR